MKDVIVYTQAGCGFCDQMKDFLRENNIEYTEKDVSKRKYFEELIELKGQGVPYTLIQKEAYAGFNQDVKVALMDVSNQK